MDADETIIATFQLCLAPQSLRKTQEPAYWIANFHSLAIIKFINHHKICDNILSLHLYYITM